MKVNWLNRINILKEAGITANRKTAATEGTGNIIMALSDCSQREWYQWCFWLDNTDIFQLGQTRLFSPTAASARAIQHWWTPIHEAIAHRFVHAPCCYALATQAIICIETVISRRDRVYFCLKWSLLEDLTHKIGSAELQFFSFMFINWQSFGKAGCLPWLFKIQFPHWNRNYNLLQRRSQWLTEQGLTNSYKLLHCLQSSFSLKILLVLSQPAPLQTTTLSYNKGLGRDYFLLVLTPSFIAASPLACLGFAWSNFAEKNKRLLAVSVLLKLSILEMWYLW